MQSPLDMSRALWEAVYVEGLEGGRAALLMKLSHAITDGLGGIALFEQVYDTEREPAPRPMPALPIPSDLDGAELARAGLARLGQTGSVGNENRLRASPWSATLPGRGRVACSRYAGVPRTWWCERDGCA